MVESQAVDRAMRSRPLQPGALWGRGAAAQAAPQSTSERGPENEQIQGEKGENTKNNSGRQVF